MESWSVLSSLPEEMDRPGNSIQWGRRPKGRLNGSVCMTVSGVLPLLTFHGHCNMIVIVIVIIIIIIDWEAL